MNPDLSWVLNDVLQVNGARHAILVSADGLLLERSTDITRDAAETYAAAVSSMQSLSRAIAPSREAPATASGGRRCSNTSTAGSS